MASMQGSSYLQPAAQWTQDPINHILRVCLPGFRKDEFKVQVDDHGKLKIRGWRPLGDDKYLRLEKVFDVPRDSHIDKIRGKFVDACLSLFIPKKVVTEKEAQTQKDQTESSLKQEESIQNKQPKIGEGAQEPAAAHEGKTKEPVAVHEGKPLTDEKQEHPVQEPIPEQTPRKSLVSDDKLEEYKKKAMAWKVKLEQELEEWLNYGLIDGLLETISKNKKTIAAAAAAFSAGFYISRNLRSSGR